jgi:hypothetical protein
VNRAAAMQAAAVVQRCGVAVLQICTDSEDFLAFVSI